jgi:MoaA/NifB/PqqE/SkfB family radical SAM enzyme
MCDIWKDNKNLKQLTEQDITGLLKPFKKFGTQQVLMSGGEALLNANFFRFCEILQKHHIKVSLLSTGLRLKKNAAALLQHVNDVIVSLDGDELLHDEIRNITGAYEKLKEGVEYIKFLKPSFKITARTVIHKLNYKRWAAIIDCAKQTRLDQISFLPADVSSHAFNREVLWTNARQHEIMLSKEELPELKRIIESIFVSHAEDFKTGFIAERPAKLRKIYDYYAALYGLVQFPYKGCNAPWVSTVIEADGTVRPCFFHDAIGNIRNNSLNEILNSPESVQWRKQLDVHADSTCLKCVCYLNLPPRAAIS